MDLICGDVPGLGNCLIISFVVSMLTPLLVDSDCEDFFGAFSVIIGDSTLTETAKTAALAIRQDLRLYVSINASHRVPGIHQNVAMCRCCQSEHSSVQTMHHHPFFLLLRHPLLLFRHPLLLFRFSLMMKKTCKTRYVFVIFLLCILVIIHLFLVMLAILVMVVQCFSLCA